jgi:tetratricopeptide (TPR) repeat protein
MEMISRRLVGPFLSLVLPIVLFPQCTARDYYDRGVIRQNQGDLDGAIADYNRAIELDPGVTRAYNNRGLAKYKKGDIDGAMADYNRAIELDPKPAYSYVNRASVKGRKGDLVGAIA